MSDEKKSTYKGQTEARRRANTKYLHESVEDIRARVPKGKKAIIQDHAKSQGESLNQFVIRAIDETMLRDNQRSGPGLFASPAAGSPDPVRPEGVAAVPDPSEGEAVPVPGD